MIRLNIICILLFCGLSVLAKEGYKITVKLTDFNEKEAYLGYHYGDKQYIQDTVQINQKGLFVFEGEEDLKPGIYLFIMPPDNQYIQLLVSEKEQHFTFESSAVDPVGEAKVKNSAENKLFYDYMGFINSQKPEAEKLKAMANTMEGDDKKKAEEGLEKINEKVKKYQDNLLEKEAGSMTSAIIKANLETPIPTFEGTEKEINRKRYLFYKEHYFDNIDMADARLLRTPILSKRINYYIEKLTPQHPDSIAVSLDYILGELKPSEENFKFYLIKFINDYAKSKIVGMDAVYVHLVDTYYAKGMAPWTDEKQLKKMINNSNTLKPILIGEIAPDIMMERKDKTKIALHEVDSPFTVLFIWDPDCGHCKKSMPKMLEFYESYKGKGVEVFAVCAKVTDKVPECWKFIDEHGMNIWMNVVDPYMRSKYKKLYDVRSTPQVYILDDKKEIITKRIGAEQMGEVMDSILEQYNKRKEKNSEK